MSNDQAIVNPTPSTNASSLNFIMYYIIGVLLKPFKSFNEEENKLNNTKNSVILTLIVTILMTLASLIQTIIYTVRVSSFSFSTGTTKSWDFSRLKDINYVQVIGKNFLIYACVILAITIVFYIGSLVIKKQLNFIKTLGISATSIIPIVVSMIISPILGAIWTPLGVLFTIAGAIYSILILFELMNKELQLEGDVKIYFNLVCFSILTIALYYTYMKLLMGAIGGMILQ